MAKELSEHRAPYLNLYLNHEMSVERFYKSFLPIEVNLALN